MFEPKMEETYVSSLPLMYSEKLKCRLLISFANSFDPVHAYSQVRLRLHFIMDANNIKPDQTAPLGPHSICLQYRLPKNISR